MTPPRAFADGIGLARRRAVGAGHARPGGFPGDGRWRDAAGGKRVGCRGGIYPSRRVCGNRRFPGRRGRRPLRGGLSIDGWPREVTAGEGLVVGEGFIPPGVFAAAGGFRGVGDAAPYVGGRPLTGGCANLRRGVGTPPYGCNSRKHCRGGIYAARPGGFPGNGRRREVSGASGTPPPTWVAAR